VKIGQALVFIRRNAESAGLFGGLVQAIVLASTSPYRRALLERLRVPFETRAPRADETPVPGEAPAELAARLAAAKARSVAGELPGRVVIGSDQVASCEGALLGKPGDHARAAAQLAAQSGRGVEFLTAVCVVDAAGRPHAHLDRTVVRFRRLTPTEIDAYLASERPYDCAGSFKSEGYGIALLEAIETADPTALIGLPMIATARLLRSCGIHIP
jgi:septum formation protein